MSYGFPKKTYFILDEPNQAVKIGASHEPEARLDSCQVGNPNPLRLIGTVERNVEKYLQRLFTNYRLSGEWYSWPHVRAALTETAEIIVPPHIASSLTPMLVQVKKQNYVSFASRKRKNDVIDAWSDLSTRDTTT